MKPRYKHDCDGCVFLGHIYYPAVLCSEEKHYTKFEHADLYYCGRCDSIGGGTVLARHSSKGSDYSSCMVKLIEMHYLGQREQEKMATTTPALIAGYWFAIAKGLIKGGQDGTY